MEIKDKTKKGLMMSGADKPVERMRLDDATVSEDRGLNESANNPPVNSLPAHVLVEKVAAAVHQSGYPLQTAVAALLKEHFNLTEEWGYVDRETQAKRTLDLFGFRPLFDLDKQGSINPALVLLIECKRSELPYIFFKTATSRHPKCLPAVTGLRSKSVEVPHGKGWHVRPVAEYLQLADHVFVEPGPPLCNTFCRAERRKDGFELSGAETYNSVILPLMSVLEHNYELYQEADNGDRLFPNLTLPICVLDGPMILADATQPDHDLTLTPWVRIARNESFRSNRSARWRYALIDVVHAAFLQEYVRDHVLPFTAYFQEHVMDISKVKPALPDD